MGLRRPLKKRKTEGEKITLYLNFDYFSDFCINLCLIYFFNYIFLVKKITLVCTEGNGK